MKTKSKLLVGIIGLLLVVFAIGGLTSCGFNEECPHQWGMWTTTKKATCTADGIKERKCVDCGEVQSSTIEAKGHDWDDATCTAPKTCSKCGATDGEPADHKFVLETVSNEALKSPATCMSGAVYYKSCACGEISTDINDTFINGPKGAHADNDKNHVCDNNCGKTNIGNHSDSNTDADHICDYGCGAVIENCADSAKDGDHACDVCGNVGISTHSYSSATCAAPATCFECGATTGEALPHVYNQEIVKGTTLHTPASCMNAAVYYKSCSCGAISDSETFTNGTTTSHNYNQSIAVSGALKSEATCSGAAVYYKSCLCGTISTSNADTFTSGSSSEHIYDQKVVKADALKADACCEAPETYYKSCVCGAVSESDDDLFTVGAALAHAYEMISSTEATCENAATNTYKCSLCGDEYTEEDGTALGHNITGAVGTERKVSGCEYVMVYVCQTKGCGAEVAGATVNRHNYVASINKPATCLEDGEKTIRCTNCGDSMSAVIDKNPTGHKWETGKVINNVRTDTCETCGETKNVTVYTGTVTDSINAGELADKEIALKDANISLDSGVIDQIGNQNITVSADKLAEEDRENLNLTDEQMAQVGDNPIYNFTISNGTENISDFGEDNWVTITLPYKYEEGMDVDSIAVWFISDVCADENCTDGEDCTNSAHRLVSILATYNNGYVTFKTNHFSCYTVTNLTPAERCELYDHEYACQHVEGSCTKDGYDLFVCIRCHDKYTDNVIKATGHKYSSEETVEATCTENGYVIHTCEDCGHSFRTRINALGHSWTVVDFCEPTCAANGYEKYACDNENCEEEFTVTYGKLAHDYATSVIRPTCIAEGYTNYVCGSCGHDYNDDYVAALGHSYSVSAWSWAKDYGSATAALVCDHDNEHRVVLNATVGTEIVYGTCSNFSRTTYIASVSYGGMYYSDEKSVEEGTPSHSFSTEFSKDADKHWHECVCGEKNGVTEHTFGNEVITKNPTCAEKGTSISYCECGQKKETIIPATGEHKYVNGVCESCGKTDSACDHTELEQKTIDFGALGACEFILYYDECKCGEVKIIDLEKSQIPCEIEDNYEENQYIDENGNQVATMKGACRFCGLQVSAVSIYGKTGCELSRSIVYSFSLNGEVVIDNIGYWQSQVYHQNSDYVDIDLSEYGACGGYLEVEKCNDCGMILEIRDIEPNCGIDKEKMPEEITDENGVVHSYIEIVCPDCGLTLIGDEWTENPSTCVTVQNYKVSVSCGDRIIAETHDKGTEERHQYEYTYELKGEACEDGVNVTVVCALCGDNYYYVSEGHQYDYNAELDLSEYGVCGDGIVGCNKCKICGVVDGISMFSLECNWIVRDDDITDDQGISIGNKRTYTCTKCGLVYVESEWREQTDGCEYIEYSAVTISKNGETILEFNDSWNGMIHDLEYSYEIEGNDCNERYKVIERCKNCDYVSEWWTSGHRYEMTEITLSEYGGCDGTISVERCDICGEINNYYNHNLDCDFEGDSIPEEIVDEDGFVHRITTQICTKCGLNFITDSWRDDSDSCRPRINIKQEMYIGDEKVFESLSYYGTSNHKYKYDYTFDGDSCLDGYTLNVSCENCDYSSTEYVTWHRELEYESIDLTPFGACSGSFIYHGCACGERYDMYLSDSCCDIYNENKYYDEELDRVVYVEVRICQDCGLNYTKSYYADEDVENCKSTYYYSIVINIGNTLVAEREYSETLDSHSIDTELTLVNGLGSSCEDGVVAIHKCRYCDYSWEEELRHHQEFIKEVIDLSDCGSVCGGNVLVYGCACGDFIYVDMDESRCDWDHHSCDQWIENAAEGMQYSTDGYNYFGHDAYVYICAVTDSGKNEACGYKIRCARYWLKEADSCIAYEYQTWQFGYDDETDTCQYELTFKTGNVDAFHNYVENNSYDIMKYDCVDCGSYYHRHREYDGQGFLTKEEVDAKSTLNDGGNKSRQETHKYAKDSVGNEYRSYEYYRYIDADGEEYWSERVTTQDVYSGYFGEDGIKICQAYTNSHGEDYEEKYAYVIYKGYQFRIYSYTTNNQDNSWEKYDYSYSFADGCERTVVYTNSDGVNDTTTDIICEQYHYSYETIKKPTCSQDGLECKVCMVCNKRSEEYVLEPLDHAWVKLSDGKYFCFVCGLENANGASGDIIMEDLSDKYGNGEYYTVGYYVGNNISFSQYVAVILPDGSEKIVRGIDIIELDDARAFAFRKADVEAWAIENGYFDYEVKFSFVPDLSDGSFDYGLTFGETTEIGTISDSTSFIDYICVGENNTYIITPKEDAEWIFTSISDYDSYGYLYDANGNELAYNDDGSNNGNNQFEIVYDLKAGETYTVKVRWFDTEDTAGYINLLFYTK